MWGNDSAAGPIVERRTNDNNIYPRENRTRDDFCQKFFASYH